MTETALQGLRALVTGAGRGIGRAVAEAMAREGMRVGLVARSASELRAVARGIEARGGAAVVRAFDLAEVRRIPALVRDMTRRLGGLDVLVNNAGIFLEKTLEATRIEDWDRVLRVNLVAPFALCKAAVPALGRGGGRIVNIGSTASVQGYLHQSVYCAGKHALLGFARSLALELRPKGIRVHTVCPGGVDTALLRGTGLARRMKGQPMIRPADIADLVICLLRQPPGVDVPELVVRRRVP